MTATCISCFTTGTASLLSSGFAQDEALLSNIPAATEQLIKDPLGFVEEALNVTFEVDFQGVSGHFEVDISFAAAGAFSFPLFHPVTPLGASVGDLPHLHRYISVLIGDSWTGTILAFFSLSTWSSA